MSEVPLYTIVASALAVPLLMGRGGGGPEPSIGCGIMCCTILEGVVSQQVVLQPATRLSTRGEKGAYFK